MENSEEIIFCNNVELKNLEEEICGKKVVIFKNICFKKNFKIVEILSKNTDISFCFQNSKIYHKLNFKNKANENITFGKISFKNTEFLEELDFSHYTFLNVLEFEKCSFKKKVNFSKSSFNKPNNESKNIIRFTGSVFEDEVNFKNTTFNVKLSFIGAKFQDIATFNNSIFNDEVLFNRAVFDNDFNGSRLTFNKNSQFTNVIFNGKCLLDNSDFNGVATFTNANFLQSLYFNSSVFSKKALFCNAVFVDIASFYFVVFKDIVNYSSSIFKGANFLNMIGVDLSNLTLFKLKNYIDSIKKNTTFDIFAKMQECQRLKDSFRTIKDTLVNQNNCSDALQWRKLELYMSELELEYKSNLKSIKNEKNTQKNQKELDTLNHAVSLNKGNKIQNLYNIYQLKFYRLTSDHHSDFSKIFFITLSLFAVYMFFVAFVDFTMDHKTSFDFALPNKNDFLVLNHKIVSNLTWCEVVKYVFITGLIAFIVFYICKKMIVYIALLLMPVVCMFIVYYLCSTKFILIVDLVLMCFLFFLCVILLINRSVNVLIFMSAIGTLCFIYQPGIAAPFLSIVSNDMKNYNLNKSIYDLDLKDANELSILLVGKADKNPKRFLLEHKDIIKEDILRGIYGKNVPHIQRAVAKDEILKSLNAIYYIILLLCLFSLQKTARRNSIVPS